MGLAYGPQARSGRTIAGRWMNARQRAGLSPCSSTSAFLLDIPRLIGASVCDRTGPRIKADPSLSDVLAVVPLDIERQTDIAVYEASRQRHIDTQIDKRESLIATSSTSTY